MSQIEPLELVDDLMYKDKECIQKTMEAILVIHKRIREKYPEIEPTQLRLLTHIALESFYEWQVD